ncbi:MAG TPA: S8 family serine peptidase, partial [Solirubrobacteraceae bacterium]|nr:S8 family serine peptidase [Solirubrobacteraceae bacterium]
MLRFDGHTPAVRLTVIVTACLALGATGAPSASAGPISPAQQASSQLQRATGYRASQLTSRAACGNIPAGRIRCYARVLALRTGGQTVAPRHAPAARPSAGAAAVSAPSPFTAAFLQWAYDATWLAANRGPGDTVAIVDAYGDPTAYSDMEQFRSANGLPSLPTCGATVTTSCFELVNQNGQTTNLPGNLHDETGSWNVEESLDLDAVSAVCPLCRILMVEATSDDSSGQPDLETAVSTAAALGADQISLSWGTDVPPAAAANAAPYSTITSAAVLAAAGDSSYPGPDVGYPAALPSVTAVGGTSLTADPAAPRGFDEATWGQQSCGGGHCGTESGCDTSQVVPAFQLALATGCAGRAYNDVSADADPNTGLEIYDSEPGSEGCGTASSWCIVGGTSLATPLTAAIEALTGVSGTTPAWTYQSAPLLNDIISGSDGTCPSGWSLICNAGPGWDGPTGNGSVSGDLSTGGPGTAGESALHINGEDATLAGGLYPNGETTTYQWRYWPASQPATAALSSPAATLSGPTLRAVATAV